MKSLYPNYDFIIETGYSKFAFDVIISKKYSKDNAIHWQVVFIIQIWNLLLKAILICQ